MVLKSYKSYKKVVVGKMNHPKVGIYKKNLKRPMDFLLALIAVLFLSPVLIIIAFFVRTKLGSPIFFKQERPGLNEQIFTMYKFRTMTDAKDENGNLLPDSVRLTKFGKFLRSTSLDELPELINILKGDMSIIGPRPLLVEYLPLYNDIQKRRHEVRPGLSGLAQVSGRNFLSWEDKFQLDVNYVDNMSFIGDWKIIISTIRKVFLREGINSDNATTMESFKGTKKEIVADIDMKKEKIQSIPFLNEGNLNSPIGMKFVGNSFKE